MSYSPNYTTGNNNKKMYPSFLLMLAVTWYLAARTEALADCIQYFKVEALTATYQENVNAVQRAGIESRLAIQLQDGQIYSAPITGAKYHNSYVVRQIHVNDFIPNFPDECLVKENIENVYLHAPSCSTDGWLVTSVNTYAGYCGERFTLLTSDPHFNKWVDYDNQDNYQYNARLVPLSMALSPECVMSLLLEVKTGDVNNAEFGGNDHRIVLQLRDQELQGQIERPALRNSNYTSEIYLGAEFTSGEGLCVLRSNITQVRIEAGGNDGWNIAAVATHVKTFAGDYTMLTFDPEVNRWVDGNQEENYNYNAKQLILSLV